MKHSYIHLLRSNWKSGLTVAMINIPLSISLAVASGATPLQWLLTGIWAGIFAAVFASSQYNVFWVAGALSSILFAFVLAHWEQGVYLLPLLAIISGIIMLFVYIFRITKYITLIPSTVLHGFLISVGITIALGQIAWALWLNNPVLNIPTHKEIYLSLYEVYIHISSTNLIAFGTFIWGLSFLILGKIFFPSFPSVIVLTIIGIGIGLIEKNGNYPDILLLADRFPALTFSLWQNPFPTLGIQSMTTVILLVKELFKTAFVIAVIAILETIISAKIAEKITKKHFDKDREVLGLGLANIASGFFGWLPATAVFIRTALNIKSWATHKTSAFLIAIFTLVISFFLFNWFFQYLPFPIIAAILMNIAIGLIDIKLLKHLFLIEKKAFLITLIVTFFSVVEEPVYGILIGTVITLLIFLKNVTNTEANVSIFRNNSLYKKMKLANYIREQNDGDIILMKFSGWLNYLNTEHSIEVIEKLDKNQQVLLSFSHMGDIDIDWVEAIEHMIEHLEWKNITVYCSWLSHKSNHMITKTHTYRSLVKKLRTFASTSDWLKFLLHETVN